ncbi:hypothetical protein AB0M20_38595, partial [Actinoplanes sp. NPDC051633]|uniref:hypothetical protein n=1 Tax=Actinoplanes sp. NPDC051633 TaxID=3155670 RepID=UPI00341EFB78
AGPADRAQAAAGLDQARLFWIDGSFTELAAQAAADLPALAVTPELAPSPHGLLLWAEPIGGEVAAASWTTDGDDLDVVTYRTIGAGLDGAALQRLRDQVGWLAPIRADRLTTAGGPGNAITGGPRQVHRPLITTWLLIAQQIAAAEPAVVDTAITRAYARAGRPAPDVRVLRIRGPRTGQLARPASGQRRPAAARVWVAGHWRNQPYGPGRALRRPVYIHPFLRGPQNLPIAASTTVRILGAAQRRLQPGERG